MAGSSTPEAPSAPPPGHLEILNEIARIATLDLELRPMLQRITDALRRKFGWPFVACVSIDHEAGRFVCEALSTDLKTSVRVGYNRPLGSGVVGEVAATGRPILLDDVRTATNYVATLQGARSELCVPVHHGGRTVAILNLESLREGEFHDQLPLVETIAEQIAGAIANAHLYHEVERRARLLTAVNEVSRAALEAGDLEPLLGNIVESLHRNFGVALAAIILYDADRSELELAAQAGRIALEAPRGTRWPMGRGLVGRALRLGEPQLVLDVRNDSDYLSMNDSVVCEYAVPIRFRDELLGALDLESTTPDAFSSQDLVVFRTFADQLAGAIHMAALHRRLEEANEELRQANLRLERLSALDGLTGIPNRRQLDTALDLEWRRAARTGTPLAALMIDIDEFKRYNDTHGHQRGDDTLRRVAASLAERTGRAGELVARYGGEEFLALLPGADEASALAHAETLRAAVEALAIQHELSSVAPVVTVSVGVACSRPTPNLDPATLIAAADCALYRAKAEGRNQVRTAEI